MRYCFPVRSPPGSWRLGLWLAFLLAWIAACGREPVPTSILLVTLDTTRADHIGAYGYERAHTPHIDRLAAEGVLYEQALAPVPVTLPSHTSLLTGVDPPVHGVRTNGIFTLGSDARLVSEILQERGWRTGAFVACFVLDRRYGLDQGFEVYRGPDPEGVAKRTLNVERPANEVVDEALAWLGVLVPGQPFFVWVHFFDPHFPHELPAGWERTSAPPYDAEIAFVDQQLGRLLKGLEERGLDENLLVALTADHGESLGEHGETSHGIFVYQATLHVPLILSGERSGVPVGTRVARPVSTVALTSTLLELAGVPADGLSGARVPPLPGAGAGGAPDSEQGIYVETLLPFYAFGWRALRGLLWGEHKLIAGTEPELYDLNEDPHETENLAAAEPELLARMQERLAEFEASHGAEGWEGDRELPEDERERLEALGYALEGAQGDPFGPDLPDPRDFVSEIEATSEVATLLRRAHRAHPHDPDELARKSPKRRARGRRFLLQASTILEEILSRNPRDRYAITELGPVYSRLGMHAEAVPWLEKAVHLRPGEVRLHFYLAISYDALGRREEALEEMRIARALDDSTGYYDLWIQEHSS